MDRLRYTLGARTDAGRKRAVNEDAFVILDTAGANLEADAAFVLADGMGGMESGDIAAGEAVRVVAETLAARLASLPSDVPAALLQALRRANGAVYALSLGDKGAAADKDDAPTAQRPGETSPSMAAPGGGIMGSTCVAGVIRGNTLFLAHVGDSRAYRWRENTLERLTIDHSYVEERVRAGDLSEDEARTSRFRNMITRAVGIEADIEPELSEQTLEAGDTLLVCSDGLTTMLDDAAIAANLRTMNERAGPEQTASALVDAANRGGGLDNITVLLVRAENAAAAAAAAATPPRSAARGGGLPPSGTSAAAVLSLRRSSGAAAGKPANSGRSRRTRSGAPLFSSLMAALGMAALALAAALAASPVLRERAGRLLAASTMAPIGVGRGDRGGPDLARLNYTAPQRVTNYAVRGDLLSYAAGRLHFVGVASGKLYRLNLQTGQIERSVADLVPAPPLAPPIPPTRVFVAVDTQNNAYLSQTKKKIIEKRDADGRLLKTIGGFQRPEAVAVDENGSLYVIDGNQVKVLRARAPAKSSPLRSETRSRVGDSATLTSGTGG